MKFFKMDGLIYIFRSYGFGSQSFTTPIDPGGTIPMAFDLRKIRRISELSFEFGIFSGVQIVRYTAEKQLKKQTMFFSVKTVE